MIFKDAKNGTWFKIDCGNRFYMKLPKTFNDPDGEWNSRCLCNSHSTYANFSDKQIIFPQHAERTDMLEVCRTVMEECDGKWIFGCNRVPAVVGAKIVKDADYVIRELPPFMIGGDLLFGNSGELLYPSKDIYIKKKCFFYLVIRNKFCGNVVFTDEDHGKLINTYWDKILCTFSTTCPDGEFWEWVVYRKPVGIEGYMTSFGLADPYVSAYCLHIFDGYGVEK